MILRRVSPAVVGTALAHTLLVVILPPVPLHIISPVHGDFNSGLDEQLGRCGTYSEDTTTRDVQESVRNI